jgi:hypothetical protein
MANSPRHSFQTKSGLELPLLNLKGKEYLQVMHRIQWFRTEHPHGVIKTEMVEKGGQGKDAYAIFRAEITVDNITIANAHKCETMAGFGDYIEKAESGAVGHALGMCGYGTQFSAHEFDEGSRLADSPAPVFNADPNAIPAELVEIRKRREQDEKQAQAILDASAEPPPDWVNTPYPGEPEATFDQDPGQYVIGFGKYNGRQIRALKPSELSGYVDYIERQAEAKGKKITGKVEEFVFFAKQFLAGVP